MFCFTTDTEPQKHFLIALSVWLENTGPRFSLRTPEMLPFKCLESLELFSSGPQFQARAKPRVALEDCV